MKKAAFLISSLIATVTVLGGTQIPKKDAEAIDRYLRARYDASRDLSKGEVLVTGLAYFPDGPQPERVTDTVLAEFMPSTRFYKTIVEAPPEQYAVLVSVQREGGDLTVRGTLQPNYYQRISDGFLLSFLGATATSELDRERLTRAIGELIISISYGGSLKNGLGGDSTTSDGGPAVLSGSFYDVDLWLKNTPDGRESYFGTLNLNFDLHGVVDAVFVYEKAGVGR